jgi:hypothetical protein
MPFFSRDFLFLAGTILRKRTRPKTHKACVFLPSLLRRGSGCKSRRGRGEVLPIYSRPLKGTDKRHLLPSFLRRRVGGGRPPFPSAEADGNAPKRKQT